jgi:hypothetical protein
MREVVLRDFFLGLATPVELARDVRDSIKKVGPISFEVEIEDMEGEFLVTREMLVSLCDAVLLGQLRRKSFLQSVSLWRHRRALLGMSKMSCTRSSMIGRVPKSITH